MERDRIEKALHTALNYKGFDGAHHKDWCIDKMIRDLTGSKYEEFIKKYKEGNDGPETYEYDPGIAP